MIVDTSALVALLRGEEDAPRFARALAARGASQSRSRPPTSSRRRSSSTGRATRSPAGASTRSWLKPTSTIEAVTSEQAHVARAAYRDFGKGSGHPAQLNFGDCFAYALAKATGEPLLFKGDDFGFTDYPPASLRPLYTCQGVRRQGRLPRSGGAYGRTHATAAKACTNCITQRFRRRLSLRSPGRLFLA